MVSATPVSSPPGPFWQRMNALFHQEPIASLVYAFYWGLFLLVGAPLAVVYLQCWAVVKLVQWWTHTTGEGYFRPAQQPHQEMAVVITGCDSGFGKILALQAAEAGFVVFAGCLSSDSFDQFQHGNITPVKMDVTSDSEVQEVVTTVTKWLKGSSDHKQRILHAVINNAGVGVHGDVDWIDMSGFRFCMEVNYFGKVRVCKSFLPLLKEQSVQGQYKNARILNVISAAGLLPNGVSLVAYSASKHAAHAFSVNLRLELAAFDIKVTSIYPSFHATPMVHTTNGLALKTWNNLPEEAKAEYGEAYLERFIELSVEYPRQMTWEADVVVRQIMNCLEAKRSPDELVVGSDARYLLCWLRMLPAWLFDMVMQVCYTRPVPAIVLQAAAAAQKRKLE